MFQAPDILMMAYKQPVMQDQLVMLHEKDRQIPGSVQYTIKRYQKNPHWNLDDMGMMVYQYKKEDPAQNYLELRFCLAGNVYCRKKDIECDSCKLNATPGCAERVETVDVLSFRFLSVHLSQFGRLRKAENSVSEDLLHFKHTTSFSKTL